MSEQQHRWIPGERRYYLPLRSVMVLSPSKLPVRSYITIPACWYPIGAPVWPTEQYFRLKSNGTFQSRDIHQGSFSGVEDCWNLNSLLPSFSPQFWYLRPNTQVELRFLISLLACNTINANGLRLRLRSIDLSSIHSLNYNNPADHVKWNVVTL